jgi:FkbM family methyltransferase
VSEHHKVFSRFQLFRGECPEGYQIDNFLGAKTRCEFRVESKRTATRVVQTPYPAFSEEYLEWIDILESVVSARKSYTMIELGAGFGRWAVNAALAVRQYNEKLPHRLIAVEAEPAHFEWMRLHFSDNNLDPSKHSLIHAAVSDTPGEVSFYVGSEPGDCKPNGWYGQSLIQPYEVVAQVEEKPYCGFEVRRHGSGFASISVPAVTLANILADLREVDLIDFDVQGHEGSVIRSAIDELNAKVKRLHIGTHSPLIEIGLRELLHSHGWRCLADYPAFSTSQTPWGDISFQDGVQSWVNPRLTRPWWSPFRLFS